MDYIKKLNLTSRIEYIKFKYSVSKCNVNLEDLYVTEVYKVIYLEGKDIDNNIIFLPPKDYEWERHTSNLKTKTMLATFSNISDQLNKFVNTNRILYRFIPKIPDEDFPTFFDEAEYNISWTLIQ